MKFAFIPNSYQRVFRILLILAIVAFLVSVLIDGLLYDAAEHGDDRRVQLLLRIGANPNTTDGEFGVTALREFVDLFCSDDQIYQVSDERFDHTMAIKHCQMGLLYRSRNRYREAVQEFRSALANAPNDYGTLTLLADTLVQCDELVAAVQVYEQSLAFASPSSKIDCCLKIGQLYRSLGNHVSAAAFLSQYLDLADDEDARFQQNDLGDTSEIEDDGDAQEMQVREEIQHYLSTLPRREIA